MGFRGSTLIALKNESLSAGASTPRPDNGGLTGTAYSLSLLTCNSRVVFGSPLFQGHSQSTMPHPCRTVNCLLVSIIVFALHSLQYCTIKIISCQAKKIAERKF